MEISAIGQATVLRAAVADVGATRERVRRRRLLRLTAVLLNIAGWMWIRFLTGHSSLPAMPHIPDEYRSYLVPVVLICFMGLAILLPFIVGGRSPHVLYRPSELDTTFSDMKGADVVVEEAVKTLNLFLAHRTFRDRMGGTPRRAVLFEGPPGTGKTYLAKAMAKEAGVPFLFASSTAFQSHFNGMTAKRLRSYFKALRKMAWAEGGAIGFIEEIDALGGARTGMGAESGMHGDPGAVNELLMQLQSFDHVSGSAKLRGWFVDVVNRWLPAHRQLRKKGSVPANVLVIGATNRAADLDPALLRPGRFDRSIYFDLPTRAGRREIFEFYLARKAHDADLDDPSRLDTLAAITFGYSPVMIEHLLDEALVWAIRRGAERLSWNDLHQAKMTEEIGLKQPVEYTEAERRTIATHEAGHATTAHLVGAGRRLEVLSIIKRKDALGLLAHSDIEERFTSTKTEITALIQIAFGGMVAEELFFGESGTGPAGDLQYATKAAASMVGSLGMAGSLISLEAMSGQGNIVARVLSSDGGQEAVEKILQDAKDAVSEMLTEHRWLVEALRDALLEHDELVGSEIGEVIARAMSECERSRA